jgi:chromosome segregation ATPase
MEGSEPKLVVSLQELHKYHAEERAAALHGAEATHRVNLAEVRTEHETAISTLKAEHKLDFKIQRAEFEDSKRVLLAGKLTDKAEVALRQQVEQEQAQIHGHKIRKLKHLLAAAGEKEQEGAQAQIYEQKIRKLNHLLAAASEKETLLNNRIVQLENTKQNDQPVIVSPLQFNGIDNALAREELTYQTKVAKVSSVAATAREMEAAAKLKLKVSATEHQEELEAMGAQISEIRAAADFKLKASLAEQQDELDDLRSQILDLRDALTATQAQCSRADAEVRGQRREVDQLATENNALLDQRGNLRAQSNRLQEEYQIQISMFQTQLDEALTENSALVENVTRHAAETAALEKKIVSSEQASAVLRKQLETKDQELAKLTFDLSDMSEIETLAVQSLDSLSILQGKYDRVVAEGATRVKQLQGEHEDELQAILDAHETRAETLSAELLQVREHVSKQASDHQIKLSERQDEYESRLRSRSRDFSQGRDQAAQGEIEGLRVQILGLQDELFDSQAKRVRTQPDGGHEADTGARAPGAVARNTIALGFDQLLDLQHAVIVIQRCTRGFQDRSRFLDALEHGVETIGRPRGEKRSGDAHAALKQLQVEHEVLTETFAAEIEQYALDSNALLVQNSEQASQLSAQASSEVELTMRVAELQFAHDTAICECNSLRSQVLELTDTVVDMKTALAGSQSAYRSMVAALDSAKSKHVDEAVKAAERHQQDVMRLQELVTQAQLERETSVQECAITEQQSELTVFRAQSGFAARVQAVEYDKSRLHAQMDSDRNQMRELQAKNTELLESLAELHEQRAARAVDHWARLFSVEEFSSW